MFFSVLILLVLVFILIIIPLILWISGIRVFSPGSPVNKYRKPVLVYIILSHIILAAGAVFFALFFRMIEYKILNPEPEVYKVMEQDDLVTYEGYDSGYQRFFYDGPGSSENFVFCMPEQGCDISGVRLGYRCYVYYTGEGSMAYIPDEQAADYPSGVSRVYVCDSAVVKEHLVNRKHVALILFIADYINLIVIFILAMISRKRFKGK